MTTSSKPVAFITGGSRGIGFGCARALGEAGAEVIAVARTRSDLDEVVAQIIAAGGKARAVECDVTDTAAMRATFAESGNIDFLITNAGMAWLVRWATTRTTTFAR